MSERYISVSDDEYCYFLDTMDENYKTLEDFEKAEFKQAEKEGHDIEEYEDEILELARDKYWEWVYDNYLETSDAEYLLNKLNDENNKLKLDIKGYKAVAKMLRPDFPILNIAGIKYVQLSKVAETLQQYSDKYLDIEHGDNPLRYATEVIDEIAEKLGVELE